MRLTRPESLGGRAARMGEARGYRKPSRTDFMFIANCSHLARLEEKQGNYPREALACMERWKARSPNPGGDAEINRGSPA